MPQLVNIVLCNLLIAVLSQVEKLRPRFFVALGTIYLTEERIGYREKIT